MTRAWLQGRLLLSSSPAAQKQRLLFELALLLGGFLAFLGASPLCHLCWQACGDETNEKTALLVFKNDFRRQRGIGRVLEPVHNSEGLTVPIQERHLMHRQADEHLGTRVQRDRQLRAPTRAPIGHLQIPWLHGEKGQALGGVSIGELDIEQPTHQQVITQVRAPVIAGAPRRFEPSRVASMSTMR